MGNSQPKQRHNVFIGGHNAAGKTRILYSLIGMKVQYTVPTIGFNIQNADICGTPLTFYDIGGDYALRLLWRHYLHNVSGVVYVIDLSDDQRFEEATDDLQNFVLRYINEEIPILIYANQIKRCRISDKLLSTRISQKLQNRPYFIQKSEGLEGIGLKEGMKWLVLRINQRQKRKADEQKLNKQQIPNKPNEGAIK